MFNKDFYPTPPNVIQIMLHGYEIQGKVFLEPEGGAGDIVDYLYLNGAKEVISCEKNPDLRTILKTKCKVIADDFLTVKSEDVSHIDFIIMNPPFSADEKHILHAWDIAPEGCPIIALCNIQTVKNQYYSRRRSLGAIIEDYGSYEDLEDCFSDAKRKTKVHVALVKLEKRL